MRGHHHLHMKPYYQLHLPYVDHHIYSSLRLRLGPVHIAQGRLEELQHPSWRVLCKHQPVHHGAVFDHLFRSRDHHLLIRRYCFVETVHAKGFDLLCQFYTVVESYVDAVATWWAYVHVSSEAFCKELTMRLDHVLTRGVLHLLSGSLRARIPIPRLLISCRKVAKRRIRHRFE